MNDIIEIENIIPKEYQDYIEQSVTGKKFPWYFNSNMVSPEEPLLGIPGNIQGFNHFLYEENIAVSPFFDAIYPIVLSITEKSGVRFNKVERMRFNITFRNKEITGYHLPHIDSYFPHYNAIYYVNDSDGDTVIFNETNEDFSDDIDRIKNSTWTEKYRCTPKKGKMLIFPGKYYHASSSAITSPHRVVLNINLTKVF